MAMLSLFGFSEDFPPSLYLPVTYSKPASIRAQASSMFFETFEIYSLFAFENEVANRKHHVLKFESFYPVIGTIFIF